MQREWQYKDFKLLNKIPFKKMGIYVIISCLKFLSVLDTGATISVMIQIVVLANGLKIFTG